MTKAISSKPRTIHSEEQPQREELLSLETRLSHDPHDAQIETVVNMDDAEGEAFMHQVVYVRIPESTVDGDTGFVEVSVNGIGVTIPRGKMVPIRRMHLEALVHARQDTFKQTERDLYDTRLRMRTTYTYPFEVLRDDDPRGRPWLESLMAQNG